MFSRLARPSSMSACVTRSTTLRFWSAVRPSTQVICTCGMRSSLLRMRRPSPAGTQTARIVHSFAALQLGGDAEPGKRL